MPVTVIADSRVANAIARVCALPGKEETATCFALRRSMLEACGQAWRIAYYDVLSFNHMTYDLNVLTT